jgi:hypothetical protein
MTKKVLKAISLIFLTLCLVIIGTFQYKAEKYIKNQKRDYGILYQRNRISYLPFAFFMLTDRSKDWSAFMLPYKEKGLKEFFAGQFYGSYIIHCYYNTQERDIYLKQSLENYGKIVWNEFVGAIQKKDIEYLIDNSFDTILCADCLTDSTDKDNLHPAQKIFENESKNFVDIELLKQYEYAIEINDSLLRINYKIPSKNSEELGFNLAYIFKHEKHKFKLYQRFTKQ